MTKNPFYVYALKDPRTKPARPFYIGKGTGNRAWDHVINIDESEKGDLILEIQESNFEVIHTILADDLSEGQALKIEAELIAAFGIRKRGGLLTNKVAPNPETINKKVKINIPDGCYERAQIGLGLLKASVVEMASANLDGIKNADVAKFLGLQSDYGGGSKDYLSYSVLGLLMKEGKIERTKSGKHISTNKR